MTREGKLSYITKLLSWESDTIRSGFCFDLYFFFLVYLLFDEFPSVLLGMSCSAFNACQLWQYLLCIPGLLHYHSCELRLGGLDYEAIELACYASPKVDSDSDSIMSSLASDTARKGGKQSGGICFSLCYD